MTPKKPNIQLVHISQLQPDADNVRRKMDPKKLESLKLSIALHTIRQPLEVKKLPKKGKATQRFEVVTGNRRYRASEILVAERTAEKKGKRGMYMTQARRALECAEQLPCKILTVEEAKKSKHLQLIENLQREDITAKEEADGYHWLIENESAKPSEIAAETGQTVNHVRQRLKMRNCPARLLDALDDRIISAKHCELVGKIPSKADRERITKTILNPELHDRPLDVAETEELIERDYMIRLTRRGGCPFDPEDAFLTTAGACSACSLLTKNNPDFEGQLANPGRGIRGIDPNLCTSPSCFRTKAAAAWENESATEEAKGHRVLSAEESEKTFSGHDGEIAYDSPFVYIDARPQERDTGHFASEMLPTWGQMIKSRKLEIPLVIAQHPITRKRTELLERTLATAAINAADGEKSPFANAPTDTEDKKQKSKAARETKRRRERAAIHNLDAVATKFCDDGINDDLVVALIAVNLQEQPDSRWFFEQWLEVPANGADPTSAAAGLVENIRARKPRQQDLLAYLAISVLAPSARWEGDDDPHLKLFADHLGLTLEACTTEEPKK